MLTFGQLKEAERLILWPSPGEPRNLRLAHDRFFAEGMIDIQSWVPCLQTNNTSVFAACSTYVNCAKTVVPAPVGLIKRVYTIVNENFCSMVRYRSKNFDDLEAWARNLMLFWTNPVNRTGLPDLQQGFAYPDRSNDGKCGRAQIGLWAINRKKLYVTPWLESNESLVIEWDGVVSEWKDADVLDQDYWTTDARSAVRAYVKWKHELEFGCDARRTMLLKEDYSDQLADLMHFCDRFTEVQPAVETEVAERFQSKAEIDASAIPEDESEEIFFSNIGDFGVDNADEAAVRDLVESKNPQFIISNGDNTYFANDANAYEKGVGKYYSKWIYPYSGAYEKGPAENRFWPVPGNHDYEADTQRDLRSYLAYFTLPNNERYYEKVFGPLHVFFLNSNSSYADPDGSGPTSNQAAWFKARAKLSPARWRLAIIHDAPYSSGNNNSPGHALSQWDFSGVDLVISGDSHGFERLEIGGKPFIVNGAGGRVLTGFGAPVAGSKIIVDSFGAGFMRVSCNQLVYQFYSSPDGILRDTLTLTK